MRIFIFMAAFVFSLSNALAKESKRASEEPISIESDQLVIEQKSNKGIFTGRVEVIQGDMIINSDKMIVYYTLPEGKTTEEKEAQASEDLFSNNKISKIENYGNVIITTPNEKAKGDKGEYNTTSQTFVLVGDVKLIQGKNILTGTRFVYNKLNGKGVLTSDTKVSGKKQRAKALIIPEQVK